MELSEETTREKLSSSTISARKLLQGTSLIGLLIAIVPLSAETVSVFGISLKTDGKELHAIVIITLIYLVLGFIVRSITDMTASEISRFEKKLHENTVNQTNQIINQSMDRLANLFPSKYSPKLYSDSFKSMLNTGVADQTEYNEKMMENTLNEIYEWTKADFVIIAKKEPERNQGMPPIIEEIKRDYTSVLEEILVLHEKDCRLRRRLNWPKWLFHRAMILLRFWFFDVLFPTLISVSVIALLLGWIDKTLIHNLVKWIGG